MTSLASKILWWCKELRRWGGVVTLASLPNVIRLIRASWRSDQAPAGRLLSLRLKAGRRLVCCRKGSSDIRAFEEIFVERVYAALQECAGEARYIIDCGANVGYSSVNFLHQFPESRLLAIEPDGANIELCRLNLEPEVRRGRAQAVRAALWSAEEKLLIRNYGPEWGRSVSRTDERSGLGEPVPAMTLSRLVARSGFPYLDLLKIDIEGAEEEVFRNGVAPELLQAIHIIAIELHGPACERAFFDALQSAPFTFSQAGAYWIGVNRRFQPRSASCGVLATPTV